MSYDEDAVNIINAEDRHQQQEEREIKNRILSMSNTKRKQELWNKYFAPFDYPETDLIF